MPEAEPHGRYDYVLDPSDLYVVWDRMADLPTMGAGGILAFTTAEEAVAAIRRLERRLFPEPVSGGPFLAPQGNSINMADKGGTEDAGGG